jgi:DNA-binding response OmpR family regulator
MSRVVERRHAPKATGLAHSGIAIDRTTRTQDHRRMNDPILVIEDDAHIADMVQKNLELAGFACHAVSNAEDAERQLKHLPASLIILDLGLPGMDGIDFTRRLRSANRQVPVLMLTARNTDADKVLGFEIGADDYLTKPFSTQELVARVRALLRRSSVAPESAPLARGDLRIDPERREVHLREQRIELTTLEFDLLYFLANRPGRVYSRDALMEQVWGHDRLVDSRSIDSLVSRLRRKLEPTADGPRYIQTVWGAGYRFSDG